MRPVVVVGTVVEGTVVGDNDETEEEPRSAGSRTV